MRIYLLLEVKIITTYNLFIIYLKWSSSSLYEFVCCYYDSFKLYYGPRECKACIFLLGEVIEKNQLKNASLCTWGTSLKQMAPIIKD